MRLTVEGLGAKGRFDNCLESALCVFSKGSNTFAQRTGQQFSANGVGFTYQGESRRRYRCAGFGAGRLCS